MRNLILEAGAGKHVMRLEYDGRTREVEPYSLAYKCPQGRAASEYFYVWDLTGGVNSGPGIKTFFHEKVRNLEITDKIFEPRYPIELSKAGEASSKDYFGKPFSAKTPGVRSRRAKKSSQRTVLGYGTSSYTVECPYCEKRFKRSSPTTKLNPHKQDNGFPCHGRTGYLVW